MLTRKKLIKLFALLMVVSLLISACDRPLPNNNNDNLTPTTESYPPGQEESSAGEQEQVEEPEPTTAVIEEETAGEPEQGGQETTETGGETAAEPETQGGEATTEPVEETVAEEATPEAMAEGETGEEQAETPPEETSDEGVAAGEVVTGTETTEGEAVPPEEGEVAEEAQTTEETAPETTEETTQQTAEEPTPEVTAETPSETAEPVAQSLPTTHTVAAGENLYRIGLQYNISWVAIAQYNGITNPDRIYVGQVLEIPGGAPPPGAGGQPEPVPTPMTINYIVKPGDTLFRIGQQFGVSTMEIAEANGLVNPNQIYAGQTLKIPVDAPTAPPVVHHVVQPGETLFRISLQYGVSWLAIANANDIHPPYVIYAGQTLIIPGGQ